MGPSLLFLPHLWAPLVSLALAKFSPFLFWSFALAARPLNSDASFPFSSLCNHSHGPARSCFFRPQEEAEEDDDDDDDEEEEESPERDEL